MRKKTLKALVEMLTEKLSTTEKFLKKSSADAKYWQKKFEILKRNNRKAVLRGRKLTSDHHTLTTELANKHEELIDAWRKIETMSVVKDNFNEHIEKLKEKLKSAEKAKDHYYGRVKTLKSSLERQAEEKLKLQREVAELKNSLNNML